MVDASGALPPDWWSASDDFPINAIVIIFAMRQCAAWASTLTTHKHFREKKTTEEIKDTCAQGLTLFSAYLRLELCLLHLLSSPRSLKIVTF